MKKLIFIMVLMMGMEVSQAQPTETNKSFIAIKGNQVLIKEGNCDVRHTPQSSFKIALALIGFDSGILKDGINPELNYKLDSKEKYCEPIDAQRLSKGTLNPQTWMQQSAVWYSQCIVDGSQTAENVEAKMQGLGAEKFQKYLKDLGYGNNDISGILRNENGNIENKGFTWSWLSSSIKISPQEQVKFIQDFVLTHNEVVSNEAREKTKNLLLYDAPKICGMPEMDYAKYLGEAWKNWKLYAKTGSGNLLKSDNSLDEDRKIGWFTGWIEKKFENGIVHQIPFASYFEDNGPQDTGAQVRAREEMRVKLLELINITEVSNKEVSR